MENHSSKLISGKITCKVVSDLKVEIARFEKEMSWEEVYNILSYYDIKNLAGWLRAPMYMGVGHMDDIFPPHINFAAYIQVKSEKHYIAYPSSGHGLPGDFYIKRMQFFREKFGLKQEIILFENIPANLMDY